MSVHLVSLTDAPAQPWKNGGGVTHELLTWPPRAAAVAPAIAAASVPALGPAPVPAVAAAVAAASWQLRVSVATIAADGPFSPFAGIERWFAVLEGGGVELTHPGRTVQCRVGGEPWRFDGADAPGCTLLGGATRDLNLMLRGSGRMQRVSDSAQLAGGSPWRGLFAWAPCTLHANGRAQALPAGTLAWSDDGATSNWFCEALPGAAFWLTFNG